MSTRRNMSTNPLVLMLAVAHLRRLRAAYLEYQEEVDDWYRSGEGRKPNWRVEFNDDGEVYRWNAGGSGYTFPACIHGRSLWTDYDNICGPCEDSLTLYEQALAAAWRDFNEYTKRAGVASTARDTRAPEEAVKMLIEWSIEPVRVLSTHKSPRRVLP